MAKQSGKVEAKKVFHPESCLDCLISERVGIVFECKFYGRSYMPLQGERPPYCRVISIRVNEEGNKET